MRLFCPPALLAVALMSAACGSGRFSSTPPKWASPDPACALVTMSEAAAIFGVSTDQMNDPIDVGTFTEHDEMGAQCLLTTSGSADHTVNLKVKGEGSFRGGQDARTEFSDWMATQTRVPQQQVPDLADDAVCVTPGQGNHGTLLGVVVGSRLLFVLSLSNNDSCDTLQRLAAEAVRRIGG